MARRRYADGERPITWPRGWRVLDLSPDPRMVVVAEEDIVEDALDSPLGSRRLESLADGAETVALALTDDASRPRYRVTLPAVVKRLRRAGAGRVVAVVGGAPHRPILSPERRADLEGMDGIDEVVLHDPEDQDALVTRGKTTRGTPVTVNRVVAEADLVVSAGVLNFDHVTGYSGGPATVGLGLAGTATVRANRRLVFQEDGRRHPRAATARMQGNPCFEDALEIAEAVGGAMFMADALLDLGHEMTRLFCGELRVAHLEGSRVLRGFYRMVQPRPSAIIASAGGAPYDDTLLQALGGIQHWFRCVQPQGVLLYSAACSEGMGGPRLSRWAALPPHHLRTAILDGEFDPMGLAILGLREAQHHCKVLLDSELDDEEARFFGFEPVESFPTGMARLRELSGPDLPRASWVPAASQTLGIPTT